MTLTISVGAAGDNVAAWKLCDYSVSGFRLVCRHAFGRKTCHTRNRS